MGFLRRLLGGPAPEDDGGGDPDARVDAQTEQELEAAHELELARFEQDRTTDLVRRQQQYSDRSWTPPTQGGTARSGEADEGERGGG